MVEFNSMMRMVLHMIEDGTIYLVVYQFSGSHEAYKVGQGDEEWHDAKSKARLLFRSYENVVGRGMIRWEEYP